MAGVSPMAIYTYLYTPRLVCGLTDIPLKFKGRIRVQENENDTGILCKARESKFEHFCSDILFIIKKGYVKIYLIQE